VGGGVGKVVVVAPMGMVWWCAGPPGWDWQAWHACVQCLQPDKVSFVTPADVCKNMFIR